MLLGFLAAEPVRTLWAAPELTEGQLADLRLDLTMAEPAEAARMLKPYLGDPPPGLAPSIADVLSRTEGMPADVQMPVDTWASDLLTGTRVLGLLCLCPNNLLCSG